jgi:beta-carotene hydroxylase
MQKPIATDITHAQAITIARGYEPMIAWPTFILALVVSAGFAMTAYLAASGQMSLWLAFPLNIAFAYMAYTPVHEACHRNVVDAKHRHAWLNDLTGIVAASVLLGSFHLHQLTHLAHHAHTNDPEKDPDHVMASKSVWGMLLGGVWVIFVHLRMGAKICRTRSDGMRRMLLGASQIGVALAAVAWLAVSYDAAVALLCTAGSALIAGMLLAVVFDWLPHHPHTSRERWEHTRVITFSPLVQRIVDQLLLGQSYHLVHHLYPRVPYYRYKRVFEQLRGFFESQGALIYPVEQAGFKASNKR